MSLTLTFFATLSLILVVIALVLIAVEVVRSQHLVEKVLALDTLTTVSIGFIAAICVATSTLVFVDVAIALGLVGFLATVAFARYVLERGQPAPEAEFREAARRAKAEGDAAQPVTETE